ncbi:MAG: hypothetical protein NTU44_13440 [Bacteroidetes bacterium]|nr:hypothetical protein [Bacteroidota bacterium]
MYTAKVNGSPIDTDNISLSFRLKNPMFDPNDGMEWSASFPFKLPNTIRNRSVFGFPGRLSNANMPAVDLPFEHFFNGIRLPGDTIRIKQTTAGEIEAYVKVGRGDFLSLNRDKLLTDLQFPDETWQMAHDYEPMYLYNTLTQPFPQSKFVIFPVLNRGMYKDTYWDNSWNDANSNGYGPYQNSLIFHSWGGHIINSKCITPFPYLAAVIEKIFAESKYTIKRNIFTEDAELQSLSIYNPNVCKVSGNNYYAYINLKNHLPNLKIPDFFINLRVPFGVDLYFNYYRKEVNLVSRKDVITSQEVVDFSRNVDPDYKVILDDPIEDYKFVMKGDDQDEYWKSKVSDLQKYKDSPVINVMYFTWLPPTADHATLGYVVDEDKWYIYEMDPGTGAGSWQFLSYNLQNYLVGTGDTLKVEGDIGSLISDMHQFQGYFINAWQWATPFTGQKGNFADKPIVAGAEYAPFALRLMFYRGMATATNGDTYPQGTSYNYRYYGAPYQDAKYSLRWDGDGQTARWPLQGLYQCFWKDWLEWRKRSRQVELTKLFTPAELFALDFTRKYRALNCNFILDEINFTVTNNAIKPAKVKAWTV